MEKITSVVDSHASKILYLDLFMIKEFNEDGENNEENVYFEENGHLLDIRKHEIKYLFYKV